MHHRAIATLSLCILAAAHTGCMTAAESLHCSRYWRVAWISRGTSVRSTAENPERAKKSEASPVTR